MAHSISGSTITAHDGSTASMSGNWQNGFDGPVVVVDIGGKPTQVSAARVAVALGKTIDQVRSPITPEKKNG